MNDDTDALEMIRCAQVNLQNLAKVMPAAGKAILFGVVDWQLKLAEAALMAERKKIRASLQPG